ncbi:unnamed protein product [Ectocarpus sp. 12 AP-2014]
MFGKVWALSLCTLMVAIFSASSAFGQGSCSCGGPTSGSVSTATHVNLIDPLECGDDGSSSCDPGYACVCDFEVEIDVDTSALVAGTATEPTVTWYCKHDGGDGQCTSVEDTA